MCKKHESLRRVHPPSWVLSTPSCNSCDATIHYQGNVVMGAPFYIEEAVAAALKASPHVTAACDKRIYPLTLPQGTTLPAVTYHRTSSSPHYTLQGYTSEGVVLTLTSSALTYTAAKELALALRCAMATAPINAMLRNETELYEKTTDMFCIKAEYICQQTGGYNHGE